MMKKRNIIIAVLFSVFIAGFFVLNLLTPQKAFSEQENRYLQTRPHFSFSRLFSGSFTSDYENYSSDQFAFRDGWIRLKARIELLSGKKENNGVFLCENEMLLKPMEITDESTMNANLAAVNFFAEKTEADVSLGIIPSSAGVYRFLLPQGAPGTDEEALIAEICSKAAVPCCNLYTTLSGHSAEPVFYRTDHHWTSLGAFRAYDALSEVLGYTPNNLSAYRAQTVSESFYGTAFSSSGFGWIRPDSIEQYVPSDARVFRYEGDTCTEGGLYCEEKLQTKDQYSYFLGGNASRVVVKTGNEDLPKLLLVRDSFSDSLVPFLTEHYSEIHLLDLRYYHESVADYLQENDIGSVLILYSLDNFCTDSSLQLLRQ